MYCKHCGNIIPDDSKFCYGCGTSTSEVIIQEVPIKKVKEYKGPKVWNVFALIGFISSFVAISLSYVPLYTVFLALASGVSSALGRKTKYNGFANMAFIGLLLSAIAAGVSLFMYLFIGYYVLD